MKTIVKNVVIVLVILSFYTLAGEKASAQIFGVSYSSKWDGKNKIIVTSTVKNLPALSKGVLLVEVADNSGFSPAGGTKTDSIFSSILTFSDTLMIAITYPMNYFVRVRATSKDINGKIDTAKSLSYIMIFVRPPITRGTMNLQKLIVSGIQKGIQICDVTSGFDTATASLTYSIGDTNFLHPDYAHAPTKQINEKLGPNQVSTISFDIPVNKANTYFSYQVIVHVWAGGKDTISKILWGKTPTLPNLAIVTDPYNLNGWVDSLSYWDETNTDNDSTKHVSYISDTKTGAPIDSVIKIISVGKGKVVLDNRFHNLQPQKKYYVWSCVKNGSNTTAFCANRTLIQTSIDSGAFMLYIDSVRGTNLTDEKIYWRAFTPSGSGTAIIFGMNTRTNELTQIMDATTTNQGIMKGFVYYKNCTAGITYKVTIYGFDDMFTGWYNAWQIYTSFTFTPTYPQSIQNSFTKSDKIITSSNIVTSTITLYSNDEFQIVNTSSGQAFIKKGPEIDVSDLEKGWYMTVDLKERTYQKFLKK